MYLSKQTRVPGTHLQNTLFTVWVGGQLMPISWNTTVLGEIQHVAPWLMMPISWNYYSHTAKCSMWHGSGGPFPGIV